MSLGKLHTNVRSPSSKSSAMKLIPHGLNRHSCSSKHRTTARTSLKNWNKSVCSNRAESISQWTAPLLNMTGMEEEVLWYHVVLQDDNARSHRARIVQQFLQQNNVDHFDWPALSPDLSPIEHVWYILGQHVRQRVPRPRTLQALGAALQEEWRRIPQLQIARLIRSMSRRRVACIDATGGHTQYWQICEFLLVTLYWSSIQIFSFASSATDSNGWIFVCKWNDVIKYINFRFQICLSFLLFHRTYKYP